MSNIRRTRLFLLCNPVFHLSVEPTATSIESESSVNNLEEGFIKNKQPGPAPLHNA